ncbi:MULTISPECIES: hypothetical protein [Streptosporangium]|uniref:Helicase XPB/Ssl2 N-terminal domain-containing protein n=1 Tax=Streptosporangium brasiliense TaxID=47480 RepID=A0ABT9RCJ8_9ACTN|nr:hypothetical protein [Streptosporangium brasiliense]MDP9866979.1 hypothetical protein [Streptosporangium brasiliense]
MDAESSICLSDLVPALRWSRPQQIAEALADPRLPAGWWSSVTLPKALGAAGLDWICDRLARLSVSRWDHLPLSDVLPALHVHTVDPTLPGWSEPARSAIAGLGGWSRLRRLTTGDLSGPSAPAAPEVVVTAMFREVLSRIPVVTEQPAAAAAAAPAQQQAPSAQQAPQAPSVPQAPSMPQQPSMPSQTPVPPPSAPQQPSMPQQAPPVPQQAPAPEPQVNLSDYPLVRLVDNMFRDWGPLERAVAVERLFAVDPISLRALAHKLNADRDALSMAQRAAEERVLLWLRSSESAPLTGHMFGLTEWLGAAATQEQLIGADPAHPVEVPALRAPLWRVLVTLMPDRRLQDGWLVVGDLGGLRDRTRQLLAGKPADADVVALMEHQLGIRTHSAQAWLDALASTATREEETSSQEAASEGGKQLPRRTPGANGHHHRGGQPIPQVSAGSIDPRAALATLSALSGGNTRPHLITSQRAPLHPQTTPATDPSRWQRIEVTSEHLRGGPVAVPEGYATQLGMRPGTLLSVTGPGDNAVVLVWRDHPVFDSLQPVLMRLNARPGDQVYVTVDGYRLDAQLPS